MGRKDSLRAELGAYLPHDPQERKFRDDLLALLARAADPFDRRHFDPGHVTASGFVLSPARDRLLLLRHAKLDRWLQPGGHVEPADGSVGDAAAREVREETGVQVIRATRETPFDLDVHPIPARGDAPRHLHFDVRYLWIAGSDAIERSDEAREVRWVPLARLAAVFDSPSLERLRPKLALEAGKCLE